MFGLLLVLDHALRSRQNIIGFYFAENYARPVVRNSRCKKAYLEIIDVFVDTESYISVVLAAGSDIQKLLVAVDRLFCIDICTDIGKDLRTVIEKQIEIIQTAHLIWLIRFIFDRDMEIYVLQTVLYSAGIDNAVERICGIVKTGTFAQAHIDLIFAYFRELSILFAAAAAA